MKNGGTTNIEHHDTPPSFRNASNVQQPPTAHDFKEQILLPYDHDEAIRRWDEGFSASRLNELLEKMSTV